MGHLIDKGGLAHIGDTQDHDTDHLAYLALGRGGGQLIPQQLADGGGKFLGTHAVFGVGLQHGAALGAEILGPAAGLGRVGLVGTVEDDEPGLAGGQLVHVRVAGGHRDAGVHDLADGIHILDLGGDHALGLGHVTGEPAQIVDLHRGTSLLEGSIAYAGEKEKHPLLVDALFWIDAYSFSRTLAALPTRSRR